MSDAAPRKGIRTNMPSTLAEAMLRFHEWKRTGQPVYPGGGFSGDHYDEDVFALADAFEEAWHEGRIKRKPMRISYRFDESQTLYRTEVTSGKKAYAFLLFMIDDLADCTFHAEKGDVTLDTLCKVIGQKFDMQTLSFDCTDDEAAVLIGDALGIPHGLTKPFFKSETIHDGSPSQDSA